MESLALSAYLKLSDQRMPYPMAWLRSSSLIPQLSSFYRALESLSSLGVTWSIDIRGDAVITGSNQFSNGSGLGKFELLVDSF